MAFLGAKAFTLDLVKMNIPIQFRAKYFTVHSPFIFLYDTEHFIVALYSVDS